MRRREREKTLLPKIEVNTRMPVEQPVRDTNDKHLNNFANMNLYKTTMILITIANTIAQRGNSHKIGKLQVGTTNQKYRNIWREREVGD